jgi:hypothetical protein
MVSSQIIATLACYPGWQAMSYFIMYGGLREVRRNDTGATSFHKFVILLSDAGIIAGFVKARNDPHEWLF